MLNWLKTIHNIPLDRLLFIASVIFIIFSFDPVHYQSGQWHFSFKTNPNYILLGLGIILLILIVFIFIKASEIPFKKIPSLTLPLSKKLIIASFTEDTLSIEKAISLVKYYIRYSIRECRWMIPRDKNQK